MTFSSTFLKYLIEVFSQIPAAYIAMYCNVQCAMCSVHCSVQCIAMLFQRLLLLFVAPTQEKGIDIGRYLVSELGQKCPAPLFRTTK